MKLLMFSLLFISATLYARASDISEFTFGFILSPSYTLLATTIYSEMTLDPSLKDHALVAKSDAYDFLMGDNKSKLLQETIEYFKTKNLNIKFASDIELATAIVLVY